MTAAGAGAGAARTLEPSEAAQVECIALGLLPPTLSLSDPEAPRCVLRDQEGVSVALWLADTWPPHGAEPVSGAIELRDAPTAPSYPALRRRPEEVARDFAGAAVTALVGFAPPLADERGSRVGGAPESLLFLVAAGGLRPDDAGHHRAVRAWQHAAERAGATLVLTPLWATAPDAIYAEAAAKYGAQQVFRGSDRPPVATRGGVVFFTGLSGSGKSTIAARLVALLTEERGHAVTLLDGDVVRTHLSSELGFSKRDRDVNIRRIGWVAAEVAKHGGIAIAAPIAPYTETRAAVRAMVEGQTGPGSFVLVHVSTPLAECERRDRKGLYAKARAGLIPSFTGISDPYELPHDAAVTIDTTTVDPVAAAHTVLAYLDATGRL